MCIGPISRYDAWKLASPCEAKDDADDAWDNEDDEDDADEDADEEDE